MPVADGSAQLRALAVRLRAAGEGAMVRQMAAGMRAGAKPLVPAVHDAARVELPKSGGLNVLVAGQKITVSVRTGANTVGVRLITKASAARQAEEGAVEHPVWGNRDRWRATSVTPGYWSNTLSERSPEVTPALIAVMERVGAEIQGKGI